MPRLAATLALIASVVFCADSADQLRPLVTKGFCGSRKATDTAVCGGGFGASESGVASMRQCALRCLRKCDGCKYASYSKRSNDCSLYSSCDVNKLGHRADYRTAHVGGMLVTLLSSAFGDHVGNAGGGAIATLVRPTRTLLPARVAPIAVTDGPMADRRSSTPAGGGGKRVESKGTERIANWAKTEWTILLTVNDGFYDFFQNWWAHFDRLNLTQKVVVVAEDDAVYAKLKSNSRFVIERSHLTQAAAHVYDGKEYKQMVSTRAQHILRHLREGENIYCTPTLTRSGDLIRPTI